MSTRLIARPSTSSTTSTTASSRPESATTATSFTSSSRSGPELEEALLACLKDANDTMKIEVLKAGSTLSGAGDERFTLAALTLIAGPKPRSPPNRPLRLRRWPKRSPEPGPSRRCAPNRFRRNSRIVIPTGPRISYHATPDTNTYAAFLKESRRSFTNARRFTGNPEGAEGPAVSLDQQQRARLAAAKMNRPPNAALPATAPPPDPQLVAKVVEILNHGNPDSQAVVLPMLAALPSDSPWATQPEVLTALRGSVRATTPPRQLRSGSERGLLLQNPDAGHRSATASPCRPERSQPGRPESLRQSLPGALPGRPANHRLGQTSFAHLDPSATSILLEEVGDPKFYEPSRGSLGRSHLAGSGLLPEQEPGSHQAPRRTCSTTPWS